MGEQQRTRCTVTQSSTEGPPLPASSGGRSALDPLLADCPGVCLQSSAHQRCEVSATRPPVGFKFQPCVVESTVAAGPTFEPPSSSPLLISSNTPRSCFSIHRSSFRSRRRWSLFCFTKADRRTRTCRHTHTHKGTCCSILPRKGSDKCALLSSVASTTPSVHPPPSPTPVAATNVRHFSGTSHHPPQRERHHR